jgi:catechol 2,3-dioxygenase-like lactoylglutathione lyase family enzyme
MRSLSHLSTLMSERVLITTTAIVLAIFAAQPLLAQSMDLDGIAHVALRVANLDESRQFYETLGFEKAFEFAEAGKATELFMKINDRQFIELYPRTQDSQAVGLMHVCYEVHDIESLRAAYVQRELTPPEARKFRAGNLLFVLHDPEGQIVEYTQYLPGSLHAEDKGKHLGERSLSSRLQGVASAAKDVGAEKAFYVDKLGFKPLDTSHSLLRLPGESGDELTLLPAAAKTQIIFSVEREKDTAENLKQRVLIPHLDRSGVTVSDPDGNLIVFRSAAKAAGPE